MLIPARIEVGFLRNFIVGHNGRSGAIPQRGDRLLSNGQGCLNSPQGTDGLGLQVLLAGDAGLADAVVLDVLPDLTSRPSLDDLCV